MVTGKGSTIRHLGKRFLLRVGFHQYPTFIICGAQKAGTTFLYSVLRQHPQIVEPVDKEAHFFDKLENYNQGLFKYKLNFDLSFRFKKGQITFEATPDYLASKEAPSRIASHFPDIKLVIVLREPVARSYSAWKMHHYLFKDHERHYSLYDPRAFEEVVEDACKGMDPWNVMNHPGRSLYGQQLKNIFDNFNRDKIHILFQRDLEESTQKTIDSIADFLNLRRFDLANVDASAERFWTNKSVKQSLDIEPDLVGRLKEYFKQDHLEIEKQLGREVLW